MLYRDLRHQVKVNKGTRRKKNKGLDKTRNVRNKLYGEINRESSTASEGQKHPVNIKHLYNICTMPAQRLRKDLISRFSPASSAGEKTAELAKLKRLQTSKKFWRWVDGPRAMLDKKTMRRGRRALTERLTASSVMHASRVRTPPIPCGVYREISLFFILNVTRRAR